MSNLEAWRVVKEAERIISEAQRPPHSALTEAQDIISEAQQPKTIELPAAAIHDMVHALQPLLAIPEKVTPEIENLQMRLSFANSQALINKDVHVDLSGQEIDFVTNHLMPYESVHKKNDGIDAYYVNSVAKYSENNPHASSSDVKAYADFSKQRLQYQLEIHEKTTLMLHTRFEAAGGIRRESFRSREALLTKSKQA